MSDVARILSQIESGDPSAADQLFPLVYDELRRLAAVRLSREKPGQTLQPTALVHDAYLRLVDVETAQRWESRAQFFVAAAEAMRRILIEQARRKGRLKRGAQLVRHDLDELEVAEPARPDSILALDAALSQLEMANAQAAQLVRLRYFAGLTLREAGETLGVSPRKADQIWAYARAWLLTEIARAAT